MAHRSLKDRVEACLREADVALNGDREWDIQVHDPRLYRRLMWQGIVGLGDAYMEGWWDCASLDELFCRALRADVPRRLAAHPVVVGRYLREKITNLQARRAASRNCEAHYDLGTDLFRAMLDRRMVYSCGYWDDAADLDEAQERKLELVCRKLALEPGMRVLDIGCGWGSFAEFAAERYGCTVVGITLSEDQLDLARERCRKLPVEIRLQDYRALDGVFDRIVSIGMLEHVGPMNYRRFMRIVDRCLTDDGMYLLHFFATRRSWPNLLDSEVTWITRRIFPGIVVPSMKQIGAAIDGLFVIEDLHNFGVHYDPTLMAWCERFERSWPALSANYGDRFHRAWTYYLRSCAGAFRARKYQVWQIVLSKTGVLGGYRATRDTGQREAVPDHGPVRWHADASQGVPTRH